MEHYLARMWNLCSDALLQQQGLSHHGDVSGRRLHSLWSISTNKERLTNTFPDYHSEYHNLFLKICFLRCTSVPIAHVSWKHWNKLDCFGDWLVLQGKSPSYLETRTVVKSGWKNVEEAFQYVWLFSYSMLNSSEVFLIVCSNEDFFSWPRNELMICWSISEVRFAWWNCGYQVHLLANKQAPQKSMRFLLLFR